MLHFVCSAKPRAATGSGRNHQWWKREPYHASNGSGTLCGLPASTGWLALDDRSAADALEDDNLCRRCAARLRKNLL
jgi:hypothetical protein